MIHQQVGDHWRELNSVERIPVMLVLGLKDIFLVLGLEGQVVGFGLEGKVLGVASKVGLKFLLSQ